MGQTHRARYCPINPPFVIKPKTDESLLLFLIIVANFFAKIYSEIFRKKIVLGVSAGEGFRPVPYYHLWGKTPRRGTLDSATALARSALSGSYYFRPRGWGGASIDRIGSKTKIDRKKGKNDDAGPPSARGPIV